MNPSVPNVYNDFFRILQDLLTYKSAFLAPVGLVLLGGFALLFWIFLGLRLMYSGERMSYGEQVWLVIQGILVVGAAIVMVRYYSRPMPLVGIPFHNLISDQARWLYVKISGGQTDAINEQLTGFILSLDSPTFGGTIGTILYVVIVLILSLVMAVTFAVIAEGFLAQAVIIFLGPLFCPFLIAPAGLDFLFWNWLKAYLVYAFYLVVAAAEVWVIGNLLTFWMRHLGLEFNSFWIGLSEVLWLFGGIIIMGFTSIFMLLNTGNLTAAILSGQGRGSGIGMLGLIGLAKKG